MLETIRNKCVKLLGGFTEEEVKRNAEVNYDAGRNVGRNELDKEARRMARDYGRLRAVVGGPLYSDAGVRLY